MRNGMTETQRELVTQALSALKNGARVWDAMDYLERALSAPDEAHTEVCNTLQAPKDQ